MGADVPAQLALGAFCLGAIDHKADRRAVEGSHLARGE
jgi:hypothetical protein